MAIGLSDIFSSLITPALQPDVPQWSQFINSTMGQYFGTTNPSVLANLKKLQAMPQTAARDKQIAHIQDNITTQQGRAFLPQFLSEENKYLPQFNQSALDMFNQNAPQEIAQQAKFGTQLGQAYQDAQKQMAPGFYGLRDAQGQALQSQVGQGLSPQEQQFYANQINAQQASKGLFDSPLGSTQEALALTQLDQAQKNINTQNIQSYLNNFQTPFVPQVANLTGTPGAGLAGNAFQAPGFNDALNATGGLQSARFARAQGTANQLGSGLGQLGGAIVSAAAGGMGGIGGAMGGAGTVGLGGGAGGAAGLGGGAGAGMGSMAGIGGGSGFNWGSALSGLLGKLQ